MIKKKHAIWKNQPRGAVTWNKCRFKQFIAIGGNYDGFTIVISGDRTVFSF